MSKFESNWCDEPIIEGRKYLCKKSYLHPPTMNSVLKDNYYEVRCSERLKVIVGCEFDCELLFSPTPLSSYTPVQFWDYFYTTKEERKFKLKKLDENGTLH
jgi:hypothetical protein